MSYLDFVASLAVLIVTTFATYINLLNYKAIMSFSLYIQVRTMGPTMIPGALINIYRIKEALSLNGVIDNLYFNESVLTRQVSLTYFDVYLGNTGPGVAKNIKWEVEYCQNKECADTEWIKGEEKVFSPYAKENIVGYLVRDIIEADQNTPKITNLILPNKTRSFPWVISIEYDKSSIIHRKNRIKEIFEILQDGTVKRVSKIEIKRKIFRKHPL